MNQFQTCILVALAADLLLGTVVFWTNYQRRANQHFLSVALSGAAWMLSLMMGARATDEASAVWWIRTAMASSYFMPATFSMLRVAIKSPQTSWFGCILRSWPFLLAAVVVGALIQTPLVVEGARLSIDWIAEPVYGPLFPVYSALFIGALALIVTLFARDMRRATGSVRIEYQFIVLAIGVGSTIGLILSIILPLFTRNSQSVRFAPLSIVAIHLIVAYGIATRRILGVATVLRRLTAYVLLLAYLSVLYLLTLYLGIFVLAAFFGPSSHAPHMFAALAVALSVAPAHGRMQQIARHLFLNVEMVDVGALVQRAGRAMQSITTLDDLLHRFANVVAHSVGAERLVILSNDGSRFVQSYPPGPDPKRLVLESGDPLVLALIQGSGPLSRDSITRRRPTPLLSGAAESLDRLHCKAAVGIYSKGLLSGTMLLGPRLSARIYGATELDALQVVADQLSVAFDNAKLYTETQNSKIYNDILLDSLTGGVVAADAERRITVFNRDAQRITRLPPERVLGQSTDALPAPLAAVLDGTLQTGQPQQDLEVALPTAADEKLYLRVASRTFHAHTGEKMGALVAFQDITAMKVLQDQIRRSDRLASMGTLSAGMAHEIKNPLVTIKTFTQLLPERYEDNEFRDTFFELVGAEVKRIDGIVNQLLTFSRPAKPQLAPTHMHEVLDDSLRLVHQELGRRDITLASDYRAAEDLILGDADLLGQAFVNFFLNACEAMQRGGRLCVTTNLQSNSHGIRPREEVPPSQATAILVSVTDTGEGIKPENLNRIFDPFFTTKSQGTGLGLAVAHGIIQEQRGAISVESKVGEGTTIFVRFPLIRKDVTA